MNIIAELIRALIAPRQQNPTGQLMKSLARAQSENEMSRFRLHEQATAATLAKATLEHEIVLLNLKLKALTEVIGGAQAELTKWQDGNPSFRDIAAVIDGLEIIKVGVAAL